MSNLLSRRAFTATSVSLALSLTACGLSDFNAEIINEDAQKIDARVDATLEQLYADHPNIKRLSDKSSGILVIPSSKFNRSE